MITDDANSILNNNNNINNNSNNNINNNNNNNNNNNASDTDNDEVISTTTNISNAINIPSYNNDENISIEGLQFISEQDGYSYYEHVISKKKYCLSPEGFWYIWDEIQNVFQFLNDFQTFSSDENKKTTTTTTFKSDAENFNLSNKKLINKRREIPGITFDEESGFPIFPKNSKGFFILPKDENDQPFFPLDENNFTIFPYDFDKKKWTFPVDDTDEPIFPRNELNKPLIPVDEIGRPIFPVDEKGSYIFPLDETNCPIPALTPNGIPVLPIDDFGNYVIPRDREGKPLIQITNDGIPMSLADYKQWKQYYRENAKKFYEIQQQQQQQQQQFVSPSTPAQSSLGVMFHPLNLQQNAIQRMSGVAMLQRSKRVRPEDIDLPAPVEEAPPSIDYYNAQMNYINQQINVITNVVEPPTNIKENEKAIKRKKFLSAQLNFSKKVPLKTGIIGNENKQIEINELQKNSTTISEQCLQQTDYLDQSNLLNETKDENNCNNKEIKERNQSIERSVDNFKHQNKSSNNHTNEEICSNLTTHQNAILNNETKRKSEIIEGDNYVMEDMEMSSDSEFSQDETNIQQKKEQNNENITDLSNKELCNNDKILPNNKKQIINNIELKNFDINQLNESSDLDFVKQLITYTRQRYDEIKKRIFDLENERSLEKEKLKKLFEVETKIEERLGIEFEQSSN